MKYTIDKKGVMSVKVSPAVDLGEMWFNPTNYWKIVPPHLRHKVKKVKLVHRDS